MLAQLLENLLDTEAYSTQVKTLGIMLLVTGFFTVCFVSGNGPTHPQDVADARALEYRGIVKRKGLNIRRQIQIWVTTKGGTEEANQLLSFYREPEFSQVVLTMPDNIFPYGEAHHFELPIRAHVGDSIIKKHGELIASVIRGDSVQTFRYKCPWHSTLL